VPCYGRGREHGHWELVAVALVASGYVDIQPWHDDTTDELWQACGFETKRVFAHVHFDNEHHLRTPQPPPESPWAATAG
jgi:hypothetical protein